MNMDFWNKKTVLITGHTGFKGSWLAIYLKELGANVVGYSLDPKHEKDNYVLCNLKNKIKDIRGDIRDIDKLWSVFEKHSPDIVFHLAAQPLVIDSYKDPYTTYDTNVMGTLNVLECIKRLDKKVSAVMITTDKCYKNKEQIWGYRENDPLGGYDPYSSSKACCEILIDSFRNSFFNIKDYNIHQKSISSVRAGNVIGGGDWSDFRIIPDCIKSIENNEEMIIKNPYSIRPWQHVLEPLRGYILVAQKSYINPQKYSGEYNFGPNLKDMVTVSNLVSKIYGYYKIDKNIKIENNTKFHETKVLFLDISKSKLILSWEPMLDIDKTIEWTVNWYKNYKDNEVYQICKNQVLQYINLVGDMYE